MKITKKMILNLANDDWNEGIIDFELFVKIIASELNLSVISKKHTPVFNKAYSIYVHQCLCKRVDKKFNQIIQIENFENTNLFYRMINYCNNLSFNNEQQFYEDACKKISSTLAYYKGIVLPVQNEISDEYNDTLDIDYDNIDIGFLKNKMIFIELLKQSNLYLCSKQCYEYRCKKDENRKLRLNNRLCEKEHKWMKGAFDYLLKKAIDEEDTKYIEELTFGFNNFICEQKNIDKIKKHLEIYTAKYLDDGKRNHRKHYEFKKQLKNINKYCLISGKELGIKEGLDCCHIKPYLYCDEDECIDGNNGIILMHEFHVMFDKGLITFDNDGTLIVSPFISREDKEKIQRYNTDKSNIEVHNNERKHKYLEWHRQNVFIDGKKFMNFEFNYKIKHWTERYEIVKHYLEDYQVSMEQLRKMYDYVLYAMDKTLTKPNEPCLDKLHYKILCDLCEGITSYCDKRNGKKVSNEKITNYSQAKTNIERLEKYYDYVEPSIIPQIISYEDLYNKIKEKDNNEFKGASKHTIIYSLFDDIGECNKALNDVNEVRIKQGIIQKHSLFNNFDFEYNNKIIRNTLKNWKLIEEVAHDYPFSYANIILLDMKEALKSIKLTQKQTLTLYKTLKNIPLLENEYGNYSEVIEKLYKKLNKN